MQVPWGWIKQRPHFLAEGLAEMYHVKVLHDKDSKYKQKLEKTKSSRLTVKTFLSIQIFKNLNVISLFNYYIKKISCIFNALRTDIIWITFPNQFAHIHHFLPKSKIIVYDNMDDALAFFNFNPSLTQLEKELCTRANYIFCSSNNLRQKLIERHNTPEQKIKIINNAISLPNTNNSLTNLPDSLSQLYSIFQKNIIYIGTIASWMDFSLLASVLEMNPNINIILIGPHEENINLPIHNRLKYHKPINHNLVYPAMHKADALVMPFVINEIILGVNPVKAYEYIYSGKPVILTKYPETEKFKDYCYLYSSQTDFLNLCDKLVKDILPPLVSEKEAKTYGQNNTWDARTKDIISYLNEN